VEDRIYLFIYWTWPTQFHTWFLLNSSNKFFFPYLSYKTGTALLTALFNNNAPLPHREHTSFSPFLSTNIYLKIKDDRMQYALAYLFKGAVVKISKKMLRNILSSILAQLDLG
jgi:hypothetical protein